MSNRQDLIKSAVSFLSSPNVQSADREKKVAFLQKKGLTQEEIDEAFQVAEQEGNNNTVNNNTVNNNTVNSNTANNNTANNNSKPLLPSRTQYPTIMYYPPTPSMPAEKVFALAVIVGMGAVGLTASVIGILRRLILPIFNRIAQYQRTRYQQRKEIAEKLTKAIQTWDTENDDLDALIDQGEEKTVCEALVKHQAELKLTLDRLIETAKPTASSSSYGHLQTPLIDFKSTLMSLDTPAYGFYKPSNLDTTVSGLKSDIRSLKAVLLNRRNFPGA